MPISITARLMIFLRPLSQQMVDMKAMMNSEELAALLTIKPYRARAIIRQINDEMRAAGYYVMNTRPPQAPSAKVLQYLKKMGINLKENQ